MAGPELWPGLMVAGLLLIAVYLIIALLIPIFIYQIKMNTEVTRNEIKKLNQFLMKGEIEDSKLAQTEQDKFAGDHIMPKDKPESIRSLIDKYGSKHPGE